MLIILSCMVVGILLGYIAHRRHHNLSLNRMITVLIWLLLLLLGIEIGSDHSLIIRLGTLGLDALLITLGAIVGSLLLSALLWAWIQKQKR